jgi:hypothetical protein
VGTHEAFSASALTYRDNCADAKATSAGDIDIGSRSSHLFSRFEVTIHSRAAIRITDSFVRQVPRKRTQVQCAVDFSFFSTPKLPRLCQSLITASTLIGVRLIG